MIRREVVVEEAPATPIEALRIWILSGAPTLLLGSRTYRRFLGSFVWTLSLTRITIELLGQQSHHQVLLLKPSSTLILIIANPSGLHAPYCLVGRSFFSLPLGGGRGWPVIGAWGRYNYANLMAPTATMYRDPHPCIAKSAEYIISLTGGRMDGKKR
jgi:hypothetical protein